VRPQLFARRNRIISGLASGTLVVEAGRESGSLITAALAQQQGRPVFAIPGSIRNPLARGCHTLIRAGARLVETPGEVLEELGISLEHQCVASGTPARAVRAGQAAPLDKAYEMLLDALGFEPVSINWLVERTGVPSATLSSMLLILELEGRVAPHSGGRYCRLS
jgi:DNA processing protein